MIMPGWTSIQTTGWMSNFFFWVSIFALVLLGMAEVVSHYYGQRHDTLLAQQRQAEKDASDGEIARLHRDTAQITRETEQLRNDNLRLRKELGPRQLNRAAFIAALRGKPSLDVEVLYFPDDSDSIALSQDIASAIEAAGWPKPARAPIARNSDQVESTAGFVGGQPTGITIVHTTAAPGTWPTSETSLKALEEAIRAGVGKVQMNLDGPISPPPQILRVVVAPRG